MPVKRIGIVGGLSAESTATFYLALTRECIVQRGTADYPEMVIFSVSFQTLMRWAHAGQWDKFAARLAEGLRVVERGGADFALIAANMPHVVFDQVADQSSLPLLHIADAVAERAGAAGYRQVALLGTRTTMGAAFYPDRLRRYGIATLVPDAADQEAIQHVIDSELVRGVTTAESTRRLQGVIRALEGQGAEAVILGCTEIPLLINAANSPLPLLDSTQILAERALQEALTTST